MDFCRCNGIVRCDEQCNNSEEGSVKSLRSMAMAMERYDKQIVKHTPIRCHPPQVPHTAARCQRQSGHLKLTGRCWWDGCSEKTPGSQSQSLSKTSDVFLPSWFRLKIVSHWVQSSPKTAEQGCRVAPMVQKPDVLGVQLEKSACSTRKPVLIINLFGNNPPK